MFKITVFSEQQQLATIHEAGAIEFGRATVSQGGRRLVINDKHVSRNHLRVEERPPGVLTLTNLSSTGTVALPEKLLKPSETTTMPMPLGITLGQTTIDFAPILAGSQQTAEESPFGMTDRTLGPATDTAIVSALGDAPLAVRLAKWLETVLEVQQAAAGTNEFYGATAQAVVDRIGLDRGFVLLRAGDGWQVVASHTGLRRAERGYSRTVAHHILEQKQMLFECPASSTDQTSLRELEAVVAAPFFDTAGEVLGIVYGSRDARAMGGKYVIQPLEAQVVQLLAAAVGTGLARLRRELEAATAQARFEQFCSPELAAELQRNPELLDGTEREVTILFADMRNFTSLSQKLPTEILYRLMSEVMDLLTDCVIENGGIIVDYYGDGLCAMWNAPTVQEDHADRACRTALEMLAALPAWNRHWEGTLATGVDVGVGVNTGISQVGNAGSSRRVKYGPRGHAVNLASRVQGATKHFGVRTLITRETHDRLQAPPALRRVGQAYLAGVATPVELFEMHRQPANPDWITISRQYEQALAFFERGEIEHARELVTALLANRSTSRDGPLRELGRRLESAAKLSDGPFDPVFRFDTK